MTLASRIARLESSPAARALRREAPPYPPETILDTPEEIEAAIRLREWMRTRKSPEEPVPPDLIPDVEALRAGRARNAYRVAH